MSYFDNIVFDENTLLEGEQAEAYKARKAAEKKAKEKAEKEHYNKRYPSISGEEDELFTFRRIPGNQARHYKPFTDNKELSDTDIIYSYKPKDKDKNEKDKARIKKSNEIIDKEKSRRSEASDNAYEKYKNKRDEKLDFGTKPKFFGKRDYEKKVNELKTKHQDEVKAARKDYENKKDAYRRVNGIVTNDAVNRHLRKHPQAEACLEYAELALELYNPELIEL